VRKSLGRHEIATVQTTSIDEDAYLGDTLYRIHGTNRPGSIGGAVSHGCFRMHNPHIVELYEKVQVGASVCVVP
jgi:lipoprotein-anchoring transpeptidase ErfK/SrfK